MNDKKILCDDIYFNSSLLIKEYLKLTKKQNSYQLGNEILNIFLKITSLKTKNFQEAKFKNSCINFLKGNIESKFKNIFIKIEDPKENNIYGNINCKSQNINNIIKNKISEIRNNEKSTKKLNEIKSDKNNNNINKNEKNIFEYKKKENNKEASNNIYKKEISKEYYDFNAHYINEKYKQNEIMNENIQLNNKKFANNKKSKYLPSIIDKLINNKINIKIIEKLKDFSKDNNEEVKNQIRKTIDEYFRKLNQIIINLNNNIEIENEYLNKLIILICAIFPFLLKNQKEQILKLKIQNGFINYLKRNLLLFNNGEETNKIDNIFNDIILSSSINKDKIKNNLIEIEKNIYNDFIKQRTFIYYAYKIILFYKIIYGNNKKNIILKKLTFKIQLILWNYKALNINYEEFVNIYKDLLFMKTFYTKIYENELKDEYIKDFINSIFNYIQGKYKLNKSIDKDIETLFDKSENEIYYQIMDKNNGILPHFYKLDESSIKYLIKYSSFLSKKLKNNFLDNICSLVNIKKYFISDIFNLYKENLIKIEKEIFIRGKQFLTNKKTRNNIISQYSKKENFERIFNDFSFKLNKYMKEEYRNKFKLFPFGSITEFLSTDKSDLDIYLYIEESNIDIIVNLLNNVVVSCRKFCDNVKKVISSRICLITLKFENCDMDLSITGFSPYIHSILIKEYSLVDVRFPLIAITLKYFSNITNLNKDFYLNSFSWMMLLITFLQDIIKPPVLPKLFSNNETNEIYYKKIEFGNNNGEKTFMDFFENVKSEIIPIPECLINKDKLFKKCKELYKNNKKKFGCHKNKMTCSELFLKFLEFITYYCKFDTIYARCSIEKEGFFNMSDIENFEENNKNENSDSSFYYYFTKKYNKYIDIKRRITIRDGLILIRDPLDPHYNPAQKFKDEESFEKFINILKYSYSILIKYGSFETLKEKIKEINDERSKKV